MDKAGSGQRRPTGLVLQATPGPVRLPLTWETDIVVLLSPLCVPEATHLAWNWESRARKRRVSEHPQLTSKAQSRGLFPSPDGSSARAQDSWAPED